MKKRKLPIGGVQTFSKLRNEYDVYVDKTMYIYEIATRYEVVFLARPRRFGKSLLCSTIESLFRNEDEYFRGLAISKTDWEWKEHPVIHLELAGIDYTDNGVSALVNTLNDQLDDVCRQFGISIERSEFIDSRFARVIAVLSEKFGPVVVIIDEYDNPLLSTLDHLEINKRIREKLKGFYGVLKRSDRYLRFVFVTGVTKFAQVSVFSGFNQPMDISMMPEFNAICGVTQRELEEVFEPEITEFATVHGNRDTYLEKLKTYYNGYSFSDERATVYNIYGVLNHFNASGKFLPFWSMSGEPSFMRKYFEARVGDIVDVEGAQMEAGDFGDYRDDTIKLYPLLYQTGYLTIAGYNEKTGKYSLSFPNVEVRQSFAKYMQNNYSRADETLTNSTSIMLINALLAGKPDEFMSILKIFLSKVDYSLSSKITEYYFEFAVSNIINMLGLECKNEVHTANGRMDAVIFADEYIYVFEFKVDKTVEEAIWQLEKKDYASIYSGAGKNIIEVGVVFSREQRNIIDWEVRSKI